MLHVRPVNPAKMSPSEFCCQVLAGPETGIESCVISFCSVPPAAAVESPTSLDGPFASADRMIFVLSGELEVGVNGEFRAAPTGTFVLLPSHVQHTLQNKGSDGATFLDVLAPTPSRQHADRPPVRSPVQFDDLIRPVRGGDFMEHRSHAAQGAPFDVKVLVDSDTGSDCARVFAAMVQTGSGTNRHIHLFDQFYFVLSGKFKVEVGLAVLEAMPNSLVVLPAGIVHRNWNDGPEPVAQITILAPHPIPGVPRSIPAALELLPGLQQSA